MNDAAAFARLIDALRPWLGKLVLVGGWAHRLHRLSPLATLPPHQPVVTLDADLAFSPEGLLEGNIAAALRNAGFHEEFRGEHTPPVSRYTLGRDAGGFYAEFLAPLTGSRINRDGRPDVTLARAGVTAQKLRYVDVLLVAPMLVEAGESTGFPLDPPAAVKTANPVSFIAQKLLIRKERMLDKRSQDLLYIHDTLELFGHRLGMLAEMWRRDIRPRVSPNVARTIERLSRDQFAEVNDAMRGAVRIPPDRRLSPENLRALCTFGLNEIFG